jgi:hypothetical protein
MSVGHQTFREYVLGSQKLIKTDWIKYLYYCEFYSIFIKDEYFGIYIHGYNETILNIIKDVINEIIDIKEFNINDFNEESFEIPHPDGTMKINFPKNIDTSKPLRVKGKGFRYNGVGDLFINQYLKYEKT